VRKIIPAIAFPSYILLSVALDHRRKKNMEKNFKNASAKHPSLVISLKVFWMQDFFIQFYSNISQID